MKISLLFSSNGLSQCRYSLLEQTNKAWASADQNISNLPNKIWQSLNFKGYFQVNTLAVLLSNKKN